VRIKAVKGSRWSEVIRSQGYDPRGPPFVKAVLKHDEATKLCFPVSRSKSTKNLRFYSCRDRLLHQRSILDMARICLSYNKHMLLLHYWCRRQSKWWL